MQRKRPDFLLLLFMYLLGLVPLWIYEGHFPYLYGTFLPLYWVYKYGYSSDSNKKDQ